MWGGGASCLVAGRSRVGELGGGRASRDAQVSMVVGPRSKVACAAAV